MSIIYGSRIAAVLRAIDFPIDLPFLRFLRFPQEERLTEILKELLPELKQVDPSSTRAGLWWIL